MRGWVESHPVKALTLIAVIGAILGNQIIAPVSAAQSPATAACAAPPRSPADILTLLERTDIATPAATTDGSTLPTGATASSDDEAAIIATVSAWLACQNAGEPLRAWALFSDGYLYRLLSREAGLSMDSLKKLATPTPSSAKPAQIDEITDMRVLPDNRLGASVTISYPSIPMPKRFFFYFERVDSGLLIDSILGEISFSVP